MVTRLSSSVDEGGDRVVAAGGLAQGAAGGVGSARGRRKARVRWARRTPSAGGPSRRTPLLQHGSVVEVEPVTTPSSTSRV